MVKTTRDSPLSKSQLAELWQWLSKHNINPAHRRREFTDVLPVAKLLRQYYPEMIDINYYPPRNSFDLKMNNWQLFHKRVLTKLGVRMTRGEMEQVSRSTVGPIDLLLFRIMKLDKCQKLRNASSSASGSDAEIEMGGKVKKKNSKKKIKVNSIKMSDDYAKSRLTAGCMLSGASVPVKRLSRMKSTRLHVVELNSNDKLAKIDVSCTLIKRTLEQLDEKNICIGRCQQKIAHLENMLILKGERIEELKAEIKDSTEKYMKLLPTIQDPQTVFESVTQSVKSIPKMYNVVNECQLEDIPLAMESSLSNRRKSRTTSPLRTDRKPSKRKRPKSK